VVGANLPDIDVVAYFGEPQADLAWRRGWTHGVLALLLLPLLLTGLLLLLDRLRERFGPVPSARLIPRQVLLLSAIAILSHPILDSLNTYGMRWLMPFSGRWFYGDALFIIDPWVWLALGAGVLIRPRPSIRDGRVWARPAFVALSAVGIYSAVMGLTGRAAAAITSREVAQLSGKDVENVMAGPVPGNPFVRRFVLAQRGEYRVGMFRWLTRPHVDRVNLLSFERGRPSHPAFELAVATPPAQRFLGWARFPTFAVESVAAGGYLVHIVDLRYAEQPGEGFGALSIPISIGRAYSRPLE
jgi:inner membrane protein